MNGEIELGCDTPNGCPSARLQLLFRTQRRLDHALAQLIGRQSGEILEDERLDVQANEVARLQCPVSRSKDEIPAPAVDDDDVALDVEAATPELTSCTLEGVAGQIPWVNDHGHRAFQTVGDHNQRFGYGCDLTLRRRHSQASKAGYCRGSILDF